MEFFIPTCRSLAEAESLWRATRKVAAESLHCGVSDRQIFSARYLVRRLETLATVGRPEALTGDQILMIFAADHGFLIYTENWRVEGGNPIFTGVPAEVLEFEARQELPAGASSSPRPSASSPVTARRAKAEAGGTEGH